MTSTSTRRGTGLSPVMGSPSSGERLGAPPRPIPVSETVLSATGIAAPVVRSRDRTALGRNQLRSDRRHSQAVTTPSFHHVVSVTLPLTLLSYTDFLVNDIRNLTLVPGCRKPLAPLPWQTRRARREGFWILDKASLEQTRAWTLARVTTMTWQRWR